MTLGDEGRLRAVVSAVVSRAGFDLEELTVIAAGRRRLVRVAIDSDDGVDLDTAAEVSRDISQRLDADGGDDVLGGAPYTLEVTSPGIGRPLTAPRHFRRAAGRLVTLTLADGSVLQARVLRLDGDSVLLLAGPDGLTQRSVPLSDIARAKVEVEFNPPPAAVAEWLAAHGVGTATNTGTGRSDPATDAVSDPATDAAFDPVTDPTFDRASGPAGGRGEGKAR
jgi:ribosome maturation factor RimP